MTTNEKIITLVKPEYLKKIPAIFRKHATNNTCKLIAKKNILIYMLLLKRILVMNKSKK